MRCISCRWSDKIESFDLFAPFSTFIFPCFSIRYLFFRFHMMFFVGRRRRRCRFLAGVFAWGLIETAVSTTDSDPSIFIPDADTSFFTAADSNAIDTEERTGKFSSDMFSSLSSAPFSGLNVLSQADDSEPSVFEYGNGPNLGNWDDNSHWLTADSGSNLDSEAAPLDEVSSSCIGDDNDSSNVLSIYFGKRKKKTRREDSRSMCPENNKVPASLPGHNLPDLTHPEQPSSESKTKPEVGVEPLTQNEYRCPPQQREHVCCSGPVIEEYPFFGLYEQVQNCAPCMFFFSSFPISSFMGIVHVPQQNCFNSADKFYSREGIVLCFTPTLEFCCETVIPVLLVGTNTASYVYMYMIDHSISSAFCTAYTL